MDPRRKCPLGYYFSLSAEYTPLPQHAIAGYDCYDILCMEGYDLIDAQCIPSNVTQNIICICVLFALLLALSVAVSILIIKLITWEKFYITHTIHNTETKQEHVSRRSSVITNVVFDDNSQNMLDGMFSSDENSQDSESDDNVNE